MSYMDQIISDIGEEVTIRVVTKEDPNKWGDAEESVSEKSVRGHFQILSTEDDEVTEGTFKSGDLRAFFDSTAKYISRGNRIIYKDQKYEIEEVIDEPDIMEGSHIQVLAKVV